MDIDPRMPAQGMTPWHITWGTYGTRLHGDSRLTVERTSEGGTCIISRDDRRHAHARGRLQAPPLLLTNTQMILIEQAIPSICARGGWGFRCCACGGERDHVHVLCDVPLETHGKVVRKWMKRWLSEALHERFPSHDSNFRGWWAEGGSTKVVKDLEYLRNVHRYLMEQRATP